MSTSVGARIRQVRIARGLSQTELSKLASLKGNAQISKIENGLGKIDDELLVDLASSLGCGVGFLRRPPVDVVSTKPWLRAYADASARAVEGVLMDNLLHHETAAALGLRRIPEHIPAFSGDEHDAEAIEDFAQEVRAAAGIDDGAVVGNTMRALERLGCVVLPLDDELGRHLGISQYVDGVPYVRVSRARPNVPGDRQRFTLAHELGHLALHSTCPPPDSSETAKHIESQAHRFAGAFLTPRDALLEDLDALGGRVTLNSLQQLKARWGVAIKMLVTRLRQLGAIEDAQAVALYKLISKKGWNSGEPVEVSHESAIWFGRALQQYWQGRDPIEATSERLEVGKDMLRSWLDWTEPVCQPSADVIPMPEPHQEHKSARVVDATVTPLRPRVRR